MINLTGRLAVIAVSGLVLSAIVSGCSGSKDTEPTTTAPVVVAPKSGAPGARKDVVLRSPMDNYKKSATPAPATP